MVTDSKNNAQLKAVLDFRNIELEDVIIVHDIKENKSLVIDDRRRFHKPG